MPGHTPHVACYHTCLIRYMDEAVCGERACREISGYHDSGMVSLNAQEMIMTRRARGRESESQESGGVEAREEDGG